MNAKLLILTAVLLSNAAFAQPAPKMEMKPSTHSSAESSRKPIQSLTKSQARAAKMSRLVENFERIDANNDGIVTRNELRAYALSTRRHVPMT